MSRRTAMMLTVGCAVLVWPVVTRSAAAQGLEPPRAAASPADERGPQAAWRLPPLERPVSLAMVDATLGAALKEISRRSGVELTYSARVVPVSRRVTVRMTDVTVREALDTVLRGTGIVVREVEGRVVLARRRSDESSGASADRSSADAPEPRITGLVAGRVRDAATGRPLDRVGVSIVDSTVSVFAFSNDSGIYVLSEVPSGEHKVRARLIGFKPAEHRVVVTDGRLEGLDFALELTGSRLQEVVSTATGARRRLELGNDITVIDADSIVRTQPVASVTDLLEGRVPGMVIQRTSGAPGDPARIRLRGASSPRLSNDPIVIVDGVRVYSEQSGERGGNLAASTEGGSPYAAPSPLDYIDPNSIETIEVIKGPSAATLYGQDAASGVIVITTKKGQDGPARWTMSAERGFTEMAGDFPELMVRWGHTAGNDARVFCPISNRVDGRAEAPACEADSTSRFQTLRDPELTVLDQGSRTAATVGVSGGSDALTYSVTGSYRDEVGLVKLPAYEAARFREEQGTAVPDWMHRPQALTHWGASSRLLARLGPTADVSLSATLSRTEQQRSELEQQLGSLMSTYLDRGTGTYYESDNFSGALSPTQSKLTNYHERAMAAATEFTNGANLNWRPLGWLTATADAGINIVQRSDEILLPHGFETGGLENGQLRTGQGTSVMRTVNLRALAGVPVGRGFKLQLATGVNYTGESVEDLTGDIRGLTEGTESPDPGALMSVGRRRTDRATFGWYIEPQLSHRRFWLSTGIRLDGGNTFGTRVTLPAFPKLSLSYLVSDEPFFPLKRLVPVLRLRLAYGQAGRQPGPVDRLRLYGPTAPVLLNGELVDGVVLDRIGNTKLEPERSTEIEGGFDADLLDDRLTLSLTGYRKTTTDAMLAVPLPPSVYGMSVTTLTNIGTIRNSGLEASFGARVVRSDPVTWDVQVAVSQQRNVVVELGRGVEPFWAEGNPLDGGTRVVAGYPLFGRWTRPLLGFADADGNGIVGEDEVLTGDTAVFVGGTLPNYTANLSTTLTLLRGAVAVTAGFMYEDGLSQKNDVGRRLATFTAGWNDPESPLAEQARLWDRTGYSWVQTVSTLRFNTLAVTYNLPSYVAQRVRARAVSLSLQGTNLGLRTNYSGIDPNVNAYSTGNGVIDSGVLPRPRTWQVRLNATY